MIQKLFHNYTRKRWPRTNKGQAMLISVIFFLSISLTIVVGIATPILKQVRGTLDLARSKESYFLAAGGLEDALYRMKIGRTVTTGDTVFLNNATSTITLTTDVNARTILATASIGGMVRKLEAGVRIGVGIAFTYAVQSGLGGFVLNNNAGVTGNVYSNGDIVGSSGSYVTGSAYAANTASLTADQVNDTPSSIPTCTGTNCINFDQANATEDFAQSFQVSTTSAVNKVQLFIKRTATAPSNLTIRIVSDSAGSPSTFVLDSVTMNASSATTNFGWVEAVFPNNPMLTAGTTYWLVLDGSFNASRYYTIGANSSYANGLAKTGKYSGTWNASSGLDGYFRLYLGGLTSSISNVIVGTGVVGDAWAHTVTGSTVRGNLYCQTGSSNNKSCNTSRPDPESQGFPVSDANIDQWKLDAAEGGEHIGNYTLSGATGSLGPKKITGNLVVQDTATLNVTGTLYVQGNITVDNGSIIKLASSYGANSGLIVTDGRVTLGNNSSFAGSGTTGSSMMVLTTSDCPLSAACSGAYAISISNNATAVIMNAQKGTIFFSNNAGAKEATAYKIVLDNNANITYDTGLASMTFSSGPSGGWEVIRMQEVQ